MRQRQKLSWGHSPTTCTRRSLRHSMCRYGKRREQDAREEGRAVRKALEERVRRIAPASLCSATLLAPAGKTARGGQMGLCSAGRGSCPTFARAFLFLRVAQRKQQWEGKQSPQGSLCFRGTEGSSVALAKGGLVARASSFVRAAVWASAGGTRAEGAPAMCWGSGHLRNDGSLHFCTGGASQDLPLHQIPGAEQLGKPRVHLRVPSTGSREDGEPQRPPVGPRAPLGRRIKQRRCVALDLCMFLANVLPGSFQELAPRVGKGPFSLRRRMLVVQAARDRAREWGLKEKPPMVQLQFPQTRVAHQSSNVPRRAEAQARESCPTGRAEE